MVAPRPEPPAFVVFERDEDGSPYAVEVVTAERWTPALADPPRPERADVRVVRLRGAPPSEAPPPWLRIERAGGRQPAGIRERPAGYAVPRDAAATGEGGQSLGRPLWPWSPHYRAPGPALDEFLGAAALALRHPAPAPAERARRLALLAEFARGRAAPLGAAATLRASALERWLRYAYREPELLARELLLERLDAEAPPEVASALRFLNEAAVPEDGGEFAELALDRRALQEQASPWRYFEGVPFAAPLRAVQAWRDRYRPVYERHYRAVSQRAAEAARLLSPAAQAAEALRRLDGIRALGPPAGAQALGAYAAATAALGALPAEPEAGAARTAGVTLGRFPETLAHAEEAAGAVRRALETQRQRLASRAVRIVLERPGVAALDRLLQAIQTSNLDAIERVLDDALAAHIDGLLAAAETPAAPETPLERLAAAYPEVTAETLDGAMAAFRAALEDEVAAAEGGRVMLRDAPPPSGR